MGPCHGRKHRHCGFSDDDDVGLPQANVPPRQQPQQQPQQLARSPAACSPSGSKQQSKLPVACHVGINLKPEQIAAATTGRRSKVIGIGGFGKVFAADLPPLGRVAIKVATAGGERSLAAEAIHLRRCVHPAVVRALGSCWEPGTMALAIEHLPGGSLDERIALASSSNEEHGCSGCSSSSRARKAPLGWRDRLRIAYQMAAALTYLHNSARIVHCDIKPGNVLLDSDNNAVLIDFGIARPIPAGAQHTSNSPHSSGARPPASSGTRLGANGSSHVPVGGGAAAVHLKALAAGVASGGVAQMHGWCGTRDWLDPLFEQLGQLCEKSDVYSLGVIMVQLLFDSGEPREAKRVAMHQVKSGEMHLPTCLRDWPRESALAFGAAALRCCNAGDRDARPTAAELALQLRQLLLSAGEGGVARLQPGTMKLSEAPTTPSGSVVATQGASWGAASVGAASCRASNPGPWPHAASLQLELLPGGVVKGSSTLQLPQPLGVAAVPEAIVEPWHVPVTGEWDEASGMLRLSMAPDPAGDVSGTGAAAAHAAMGARRPMQFAGRYSSGRLEGQWMYKAASVAQGQGQRQVGVQVARQEPTTYWYVASKGLPAEAIALPETAAAGACSSTAAVAAAALAEGLAAAGLDASESSSRSGRCSRNTLLERGSSLVGAF